MTPEQAHRTMLDVTGARCGPCARCGPGAEPMVMVTTRQRVDWDHLLDRLCRRFTSVEKVTVDLDMGDLHAPVCPACGDEHCLTHCVWCWADCGLDDPPHLPHCPQRTGLFPAPAGTCCVVCGDPMTVYTSRIDPENDVELAVCVACAATNRPEEP